MHSTTIFALTSALLASVSSALPLDDRSGSWKRQAVVASPIMFYKPQVAASAFLAVANATDPRDGALAHEKRDEVIPKWNPYQAPPSIRPGFPGPKKSTPAAVTTSTATPAAEETGSSSTGKTCSASAECGSEARPANSNAWCDQATKSCSWRCNSKSTLVDGACVRRSVEPPTTTPAAATTTETPRVEESTAPATTTTTTAAAPPRETFKGQATFFFQNGAAGACGVYNKDSTPLVALDWRLYGNMGQASSDCGRSLTITNTANGKSVVAIAQDACPSCASTYSLDLSTGAFDAIGDRDTGILPITWYWNN